MSQRHLNALPQAFSHAGAAGAAPSPASAVLYQERGLCHVAQRNAPLAIEAFLRGVHINPALPASWGMLESLYRLQGDTGNASMAAAHVATLKRLAPEVVSATSLFSDGELAAAESMVRGYLLKRGDDVEAMPPAGANRHGPGSVRRLPSCCSPECYSWHPTIGPRASTMRVRCSSAAQVSACAPGTRDAARQLEPDQPAVPYPACDRMRRPRRACRARARSTGSCWRSCRTPNSPRRPTCIYPWRTA